MQITSLNIPDVKLIEPRRFGDDRGFFSEVYSKRSFKEAGLDFDWVQDNHAMSRDRFVLRGLHFQAPPFAQAKLVRVTKGAILDIAVDLRKGSPTYGLHVSAILSEEAWNQLLVPVGFAHGYLTLEPRTEVLYKVDNYYAPQCEGGIAWNDPELNIIWPLEGADPILSDKDKQLPLLKDLESPFRYEE